jgi:hypothetical protein
MGTGLPALLITSIGTQASGSCDETNLSEIHPVPLASSGGAALHLIALKAHSCIEGSNVLCFANITLDTTLGGRGQPQEPLRATDRFNTLHGGGRQREQDRYRNFVSAPFALTAPGDPFVAWLRREEPYRNEATLRRLAKVRQPNGGLTGSSVRSVRLQGLTEEDEPVFLTNRVADQARLASLRPLVASDGTSRLHLREWLLPQLRPAGDSGPLELANFVSCEIGRDQSWLYRPASLVSLKNGRNVLFLSKVERAKADFTSGYRLDIVAVPLGPEGGCPIFNPIPVSSILLDELFPGGSAQDSLAEMRKRPLLVESLEEGAEFLLVIPNTKRVDARVVRVSASALGLRPAGDDHGR